MIDPSLDRSSTAGNSKPRHSTTILNQYMQDYGLGDGWRLNHPNQREYSYFSHVHHSSSRIDFFLTSNSLHSDISEPQIHPSTISDHAPVTFRLNRLSQHKPTTRWRFNTSLLKDTDFDRYLRGEWASFLEINDSPNTSATLLWETGKAVIRGRIISYSSHKKKKDTELELLLEQKIKEMENKYSTTPTEETQSELR